MANKRDYYEILGVKRDASDKEIKNAYRNLAKEHHPDIGGDENKFKEISEAYDILSDKDKKANYDRFGHQSMGGHDGFHRGGMSDIYEMFRRQYSQDRQRQQFRGQTIRLNVKLTLEEIFTGVDKKFRYKKQGVCTNCNGVGGHDVVMCSHCNGSGVLTQIIQTPVGIIQNATMCPHCSGEGQTYKTQCEKCGGNGVVALDDEISISIPAGVNDGDAMSVSGKGHEVKNGQPGDVIVVITQLKHDDFLRISSNLRYVKALPYYEAILGTEIEVPTIDGGKLKLKVPAYSNNETTLRLREKGMTSISGPRGDMLVQIHVNMPDNISDGERELLEKIKEINKKLEI